MNKRFTLNSNEYIKHFINEMELSSGVSAIIASVGSGKTSYFVNKPDVIIAAPLISIKQSEIDKGAMNIFTWQAVIMKVMGTHDKSEFKTKTLVIDEVHGFYMDFNYKPSVIRDLISIFPFFKSVVVVTGTLKQEHINSFTIDRCYEVYKPQRATKVLDTYIYDKNGMASLEAFLHARKGIRKTLVLLNNKDQCNQLALRYGDKALVVNADEKANDDVLELYSTRLMGNKWDIIFGTTSIREGLSIEDEVDEVDVVIYGHTDPDVIEQFCNRFREVKKLKHIHYIVPKSEVREIADFNLSVYTEQTQVFCDAINLVYKNDKMDDNYRDYMRSTYLAEAKGSHLRYNKETESYVVDLISIDAEYFKHREKQTLLDPTLFAQRMMDFDFVVNTSTHVTGNAQVAEELKEGKRVMKAKAKAEREEMLETITNSFTSGVFNYSGNEEYDYVVDSIRKLLKKGLREDQIDMVVQGVIASKDFIQKRVWPDFNYVDIHSNVRNQILRYIAKECPNDELNMIDTRILSTMALKTTLTEFFQGDEREMKKNKEWSKLIEWRGGVLEVKDGFDVKIINRFITLGKRKEQRTASCKDIALKMFLDFKGAERYQVYPVMYTNLTGITIDKVELSEDFNQKADAVAADVRSRMKAVIGF